MILPPDQAENETILIITHILWKHKGQNMKYCNLFLKNQKFYEFIVNRIQISSKWNDESAAGTVPESQFATEKRWKHSSRAKTTSEKPTGNQGADRANIDFGHQIIVQVARAYAEGNAAAYSKQRSRILNQLVQGFLLGADRGHSRIRAESRCKLAWLLLILTFSAGFSIDCGCCKQDDNTVQIADWYA